MSWAVVVLGGITLALMWATPKVVAKRRADKRTEMFYLDLGLFLGFVDGALLIGILWWLS